MKHIKKIVLKLIVRFFCLFPKKYILLESLPDYADNTGAVYRYIINNNLESKYELVWVVNNPEDMDASVKSILKNGSRKDRYKLWYYISRSSLLVFCNQSILKVSKKQKSIYLTHGSVAKKLTAESAMAKDLDYILVQSDYLEDVSVKAYFLTSHTKFLYLGFPRNDDLLLNNNIDRNKLFNIDFKKLIIWYPTYRQHKTLKHRVHSSISIPIMYSEKEAKIINDVAKENGVLVVLKPHFVQDTSYIENLNLSNIIIINDEFLRANNIRSYQFLNLSDALITDYSSVYYDYLLRDKPIGLTWDDYDEYAEKEGFLVDTEEVFAGGEKIYNTNDFCDFIKNVADGNDILREERNKVKDLTNYYQDANSSKRVAEFILNL